MICPRCKEVLPDGTEICTVCNKKLTKRKSGLFRNFRKKKAPDSASAPEQTPKSRKTKLKIAVFALLVIAIAVLVIVLVVGMISNKGEKTAKELKSYIGDTLVNTINDSGISLSPESKFRVVNQSAGFDYLVESEDDVKVDGVHYPEWLVTLNLNNVERVVDVTFYNFEALDNNARGPKLKSTLSLKGVKDGTDYDKVKDLIDIDPYSVKYESNQITFTYKYYYKNASGDMQAMKFVVIYDDKLNYQSSENVEVNPEI